NQSKSRYAQQHPEPGISWIGPRVQRLEVKVALVLPRHIYQRRRARCRGARQIGRTSETIDSSPPPTPPRRTSEEAPTRASSTCAPGICSSASSTRPPPVTPCSSPAVPAATPSPRSQVAEWTVGIGDEKKLRAFPGATM